MLPDWSLGQDKLELETGALTYFLFPFPKKTDIFKADPSYLDNEDSYRQIKREILGENSDTESGSGSESGSDADSESSDDEDDEAKEQERLDIQDRTETNMVNLRRTIYLTIMSAAVFEEAVHKLLKLDIPEGKEVSSNWQWEESVRAYADLFHPKHAFPFLYRSSSATWSSNVVLKRGLTQSSMVTSERDSANYVECGQAVSRNASRIITIQSTGTKPIDSGISPDSSELYLEPIRSLGLLSRWFTWMKMIRLPLLVSSSRFYSKKSMNY